MSKVYETANQLEQEIKETKEYAELKAAYEALKADEAAFAAFNKLRETQMYLQKCQMEGRLGDIKPEQIEEMHQLGQQVNEFQAVVNLMEKERALSVMMEDISQIIFKPVTELYNS